MTGKDWIHTCPNYTAGFRLERGVIFDGHWPVSRISRYSGRAKTFQTEKSVSRLFGEINMSGLCGSQQGWRKETLIYVL